MDELYKSEPPKNQGSYNDYSNVFQYKNIKESDSIEKSIFTLKCPTCQANISVDISGGRKSAFCQYCGNQVVINDDVLKTEQKKIIVDEAELKKAEYEYNLRMKEMESREKYVQQQKKETMIKRIIFWGIVVLLIGFFAIKSCISNNNAIKKENEEKQKQELYKQEMENLGKISAGNYYDYTGKNYKAVLNDLTEKGFNNIELIDLNDAGGAFGLDFLGEKEDTVESVSVKGNSEFKKDDYFDSNDKVLITYH